jgi:hypothetical protein
VDNQPQTQTNPRLITAEEARNRLKAAVNFRYSSTHDDFIAQLDNIITGADTAIEFPPENVYAIATREQAIGERRTARDLKNFFTDYIETTHVLLNQLLAEDQLEPEDHRKPVNENATS